MRFSSQLAFLERKLKIDLRYALSGGFFLTLSQITSAVAAFILTIAFANLLPVETYGTYRYILALYSLVAISALPGLETSVAQSVARGYDSSLKSAMRSRFRWGLLGTFGCFVYAAYLFAHGSPVMAYLFIVMGAAIPFMESFALIANFLNAKREFKLSSFLDIGMQMVSTISLITTMVFTKNVVLILLAYFIPYIVCRLVAFVYISYTKTKESGIDPGLHSYGRSMTLFQILSRGIASADQIVLYYFLGPVQVAVFSLATAVPNRVLAVLRITGTLAFPKYAERTFAQIAESLPKRMLLFAVGILGICLGYIVLAPFVFTYIFPKYLASLAYSQVAIFYVLTSITYPFGSYLMSHKKVRDTYTMTVFTFVLKISILILLVPVLGVWGAVIGLLANAAGNIGYTYYFLYRDRIPSIGTR